MKVYELLHKPVSTFSLYKVCFSTATYVSTMWLCVFICIYLISAHSVDTYDLQFDDVCNLNAGSRPDICFSFVL